MTQRPLLWKSLQGVARLLTTLLFDLKVYGLRHVPAHGGVLIVANHQGNLDPVVLGVRMLRPLSYFAKSELFEVNTLSDWLLRSLGGIPVHLGSGDVRAVKETIRRLEEGHVLNIYPEGARSEDGEIGAMERGVALVIRRAKVPVVPAVIVGSFEAWPKHRRFPRPWPVRVRYGPPMHFEGLEPDQILSAIDCTLRHMFAELRPIAASGRADGSNRLPVAPSEGSAAIRQPQGVGAASASRRLRRRPARAAPRR
jgi:1-acyl-sn-glycerol-3-phosphate acyltransferase